MIFLFNPIAMILSLAITAINIIKFFLFIRLILYWKEISWLQSFDIAGDALTSKVTSISQYLFHKITKKKLSTKGSIISSASIKKFLQRQL